ncbi:MAG: glycosyltransferase family 39 protein [Methyloceanibacter sp.]
MVLWAVQQAVGPGPLSYLILRYALIATTGILFAVALLRTIGSTRLAAAFSLSLVLFFWFGWEIHQSVSHTLALLAAVLALFIAALAFAERPTAARAFLLGLIMGLGLMAKWSFLLLLLSLGVALAATRETRRIFRDPRTRLVLAGAALPILPFGLWLATIDLDLVGRRTMPPLGARCRSTRRFRASPPSSPASRSCFSRGSPSCCSSPGGSRRRRHRRPCCPRRWRSGSQASPRS